MKPVITKIDRIPNQQKKVRTAAYCRVSSDRESQIISLNNQKKHYETVIAARKDWELAGIYCDEGLSGTSKETRPELMRLMNDCMSGRIDLVITKSISRFARNTIDCLELVRRLNAHNVDIYFEKENLGTQETGGELILSILASIAEEESRSISDNEKWAIQKRFQKGTFKLSRAPYGYDLINGAICINPEEARIVRFIFSSILSGKGTALIAEELNERNIPTKRQGVWHAGTIQSMIRNPFFAGDMLMQKTWRDSRLHVKFNYGEFDQYYIEDHHPAIVSHEIFTAANLAIAQRGREKNNIPNEDKRLRNDPHHNRYCFTGRIICGKCGDTLKRRMIYRSDGSHAIWVCRTHLSDTSACTLKPVHEDDITHAFVTMLNKLAFSRNVLLQPYIDSLLCPSADFMHHERSMNAKQQIPVSQKLLNAEAQNQLILRYSKGYIEPVMYYRKMAELKRGVNTDHYDRRLPSPDSPRYTMIAEAKKLNTFLSGWKIKEAPFIEEAFIQFADSVRVDSRRQVTFCLKCGLELSENIAGLGG